ncbi:MAG: AmmeMemoRadiSam system radical SAM enzyme [Mariniphaga sp.]|nr:AmmeMemoRadiSam system radical SAM enzyme [Mariniphaga sp.]
MQEARFYKKYENERVQCLLCPHECKLKPGKTGNCRVRENKNGVLITQVYDKVSTISFDPIEKKPLFHFKPGKKILSIGEVGCNLHCTFCQNHHISQCSATKFNGFQPGTSIQLVDKALESTGNVGIAYTYNEPFTFYEFMYNTAQLAHNNGLNNVVVSNGFVNTGPLREILPLIDAFNIDLKAFEKKFYKKQTKGKLKPVLKALQIIAKEGKHLEITQLIIPGLNDDEIVFKDMVLWIAGELGTHVPLHLSRYFPQYKLSLPPTPSETLIRLYTLAKKYLKFVYLGNIADETYSSTWCPGCGELLIERNHYHTRILQSGFDGQCKRCGAPIHILME